MSWNVLFASEVGTSHIRAGGRCQDESVAVVEEIACGRDLLAVFVSDGAGSAVAGGTGAELAIEASLKFLSRCVGSDLRLDEALARDILTAVRTSILERAERSERSPHDYACTFLALLSERHLGTLVLQIGDGGVALDVGEGLQCMIEPMNGEYANSTRFVTDDNALQLVEIRHVTAQVSRAALFTDGLQSMSIDQPTNTPYEPFFRPFFSALKTAPLPESGTDHALLPALCRFLQSDLVNERTDDDKSLALALWVPSAGSNDTSELS